MEVLKQSVRRPAAMGFMASVLAALLPACGISDDYNVPGEDAPESPAVNSADRGMEAFRKAFPEIATMTNPDPAEVMAIVHEARASGRLADVHGPICLNEPIGPRVWFQFSIGAGTFWKTGFQDRIVRTNGRKGVEDWDQLYLVCWLPEWQPENWAFWSNQGGAYLQVDTTSGSDNIVVRGTALAPWHQFRVCRYDGKWDTIRSVETGLFLTGNETGAPLRANATLSQLSGSQLFAASKVRFSTFCPEGPRAP